MMAMQLTRKEGAPVNASRRTIVRMVGAALVVGLSGWVVWAQVGASGTVLGCVGNSGIIRGVDETTGSCRSGDTALSWYTKAGADAAFAAAEHIHSSDVPLADGPCMDDTNRYVDCGNGTVTDSVTGLIWLQQWNCLPNSTWAAANQTAAGLKDGDCLLTDKSSPGDWRLPTKDEWHATMEQANNCWIYAGGPALMDDAGTACYGTGAGSSFAGVAASAIFWSSNAYTAQGNYAWAASNGVHPSNKGTTRQVWPVRGGPR